MIFVPILLGISLLLFLITVVKLDTFIAFTLVCLFVGIASGLSINDTVATIQLGIGNTLGDLVVILGFGAMLGKLVAESGAADNITQRLVDLFGKKKHSTISNGYRIYCRDTYVLYGWFCHFGALCYCSRG